MKKRVIEFTLIHGNNPIGLLRWAENDGAYEGDSGAVLAYERAVTKAVSDGVADWYPMPETRQIAGYPVAIFEICPVLTHSGYEIAPSLQTALDEYLNGTETERNGVEEYTDELRSRGIDTEVYY